MTVKRARAKKLSENEEAGKLIRALNFIKQAQHKEGTPYQTHCVIANNMVVGFDGKLTIGTPVETGLECCPHTFNLLKSLNGCSADMAITYDSLVLTVKSGKFRSVVSCISPEITANNPADPLLVPIDDRLKEALAGAAIVADPCTAQRVITKSVLLRNNVIAATDGLSLIEFWHGCQGIPDLLIPKETAELVAQCDKKLIGIGGTSNSVTFHFEDGSFIKSNLYNGMFPDYTHILTYEGHPLPPASDFFEAVSKVAEFSETNYVFFIDGKVSSHRSYHVGTSFEVDCIPDNVKFNATYIKMLAKFMDKIEFVDNKLYFFSDNCRGCIAGAPIQEGD